MKKIYNLILGFIILTSGTSWGQQMPLLSEYMHSPALINPAMVGWEDLTAITATYRHQWTGMKNNPITFALNFRHFDEKRNMAFGGGLTHDQTGPTSFTGLNIQYAYHLKFGSEKKKEEKRHRLSIGLSLAANQYRLDGSKLQYNDANDPLIVGNSDFKILPDAGLGVFYYNDLYYVGFSVPQMISMNVKFDSDNALSNIQRIAHFYLNAGVKIELRSPKDGLSKRSLKEKSKHLLIPSIWFRYAPSSPINMNLHLRYVWHQMLGIGFGGSTDGTISFDVNVHVKKRFRIGYAFSLPVNGLTSQLGTNHEIMLTYVFGSNGNGWTFEAAEQQINLTKKDKKTSKDNKKQGTL
ncbi:type IX secretion system membrane protein PorP/SprF [Aureispira sp. CCB-E]|uniref:PorP/SprF family type IX secretion system membrane protein n=1 Tax=Aureispira sp. CCB-E TaxID=3051121 RepID=UPI002868E9E7|nr:type IX secretion system membrane protein PorP/SprF [Aureispira sp. CCB-E]WMX14025.1 type IX secretion system membrane protein PorP/SprF [Aureispira sp. CCB-E]